MEKKESTWPTPAEREAQRQQLQEGINKEMEKDPTLPDKFDGKQEQFKKSLEK